MKIRKLFFLICLTMAPAVLAAASTKAPEAPPKNPFLADSAYPMGHGDSAQQDSMTIAGPMDISRSLGSAEIQYAPVGPAHFGAQISSLYPNSKYPNGKRVLWSNGLDRIVKIDQDSFEVLNTYYFPDVRRWTETDADNSIAKLDESNKGFFALYEAYRQANKLRTLAGLYSLLDKDNTYYLANKNGEIIAYGDTDPEDPASAIEIKHQTRLPFQATGQTVGLNITFDGWLILVTEHGYVVAMSRDFSAQHVIRLKHSEGAENKTTKPTGYGWIRNSYAIDRHGGVYIVSQEHMHKVMWTGEKLSTDEADGAWTAPYLNDWGHGSGATPSLMGFGAEDQFVVITDGSPVMNLTLFWRNGIPNDWQQLAGTPSRRIAGQLPANMGNPQLDAIQSEQSVVVAGYGAMVVNNSPRNVPWYLPERAASLLISFLGSNPDHQPYGIQKFVWDPRARELKNAWVNNHISSPNCVPLVSLGSNRLYFVGARNNIWTLEAVNWDTGEADFHYLVGGQRYNSLFAGTLMDQQGRIMYGTAWGRVRLNPRIDKAGLESLEPNPDVKKVRLGSHAAPIESPVKTTLNMNPN